MKNPHDHAQGKNQVERWQNVMHYGNMAQQPYRTGILERDGYCDDWYVKVIRGPFFSFLREGSIGVSPVRMADRVSQHRQFHVERTTSFIRQRDDKAIYPVTANGAVIMNEPDTPSWESARLIPVSGIRNAEEQERRATSALLAVLSAVDEFGLAFTKPYGAPKGRLQAYIEVTLELADGSSARPDGLIQTSRGKRSWTALIEVKTGSNELKREQIETYLDLAREQGFDCVITISNQIARIPGEHPVDVDKRKTRKVALHHLSWSRILTEAVLQKSHRGVADEDQAWILDELIRYLEHPNAGAVDFCDMGEHWVGVRDAIKNGTLRSQDKKATEVAYKWEELVSFAALRLGRELGDDVQEVLTAKEKKDIAVRITNIVDAMVTHGLMPGGIRIPNTVGDITLRADLRAQQIVASVSIAAPNTGRSTTRINWLLRQLKASPQDIRLDSWGKRSRSSMSALLDKVRNKQSLLIPTDDREIVSFDVSLIRPMGLKRSSGKRSFINSVLDTLDNFYADVVQHLREWQPPAPKMERSEAEEIETKPVTSTGWGSTELIDNAVARTEAVPSDSSNSRLEPNQPPEAAGNGATGLHSLDTPVSPEPQ